MCHLSKPEQVRVFINIHTQEKDFAACLSSITYGSPFRMDAADSMQDMSVDTAKYQMCRIRTMTPVPSNHIHSGAFNVTRFALSANNF